MTKEQYFEMIALLEKGLKGHSFGNDTPGQAGCQCGWTYDATGQTVSLLSKWRGHIARILARTVRDNAA